MAAALTVCTHAGHPPRSSDTRTSDGSRYVRRDPNDSVIIFVQGIRGDPRTTWTNATTKAYWPDSMKDDPTSNKFDIYVLRYPSAFMTADYTVDQFVDVLRRDFDDAGIFSGHKKVYFLCHSMGGLVVRASLERYRGEVAQVPFIYFFSTPTTGAQLSAIARLISDNRQFDALQPCTRMNTLHRFRATGSPPDFQSLLTARTRHTKPTACGSLRRKVRPAYSIDGSTRSMPTTFKLSNQPAGKLNPTKRFARR